MRMIFRSTADPSDMQTRVEKKSARGLPCLCATGLRVAYAWLTRSLRQKPSASALESPHSLRLSYLPRSSKSFLAPGTQRGGEPPRKDTNNASFRCREAMLSPDAMTDPPSHADRGSAVAAPGHGNKERNILKCMASLYSSRKTLTR